MQQSANKLDVISPYSSAISLNGLRLHVNLGHGEDERSVLQEVNIDFRFSFFDKPKACDTDLLSDTICYHKVTTLVKEYCKGREFKLLEYLCYSLHQEIKSALDISAEIWIRVEKVHPPIEDFMGTTSFEYLG